MNNIKSEDGQCYKAKRTTKKPNEQAIIAQAINILDSRIRKSDALTSPTDVRSYLRMKLAGLKHEVFSILLLDNRHRVLDYVELFRGTINGAAVYPREVVKLVLEHNAGAVIFSHNHPSGIAEPSQADESLTRRLVEALALIEVRVLDHIVCGEGSPVSFAERGLI